jgi:4-amino-4-deoxy-L-arabinose transferase-like glycosyltransferase
MPHHQPPFPWRYLALALAVYSALQLLFLGLAPISGSTEAREAQVIDTIIRDGEWVLPLRNGIIPSKPPLFHWIGAVMSQVFGHVSELTVRLPSHLAALGVIFFSSLAAFRVARFSQTVEGELHQERVALLTPAILTLIYGFHQLASQAMVDMTFSFFVWGAIASLLLTDPEKWRSEHAISPRSRSCFWICLAGAVVARGPVGLALPIFIIGITSWFLGGLKATLREFLKPSLGWFAFLLPAAWYYAAFLQGGEAFLARQLLFENVQRFVGGEKINTESWWFYLPSLARTTAPFGLLMLCGVLVYLRKAPSLACAGGFQRFAVAPTVALIAGVLLFSLSSGKRHSYMLPLQPFIAIQCALFFSMFLERRGLPMRERFWRYARRAEGSLIILVVTLLIGFGIAHLVDWGRHPLEDIVKFSTASLTIRVALTTLVTLLAITLMRRQGTRLPYARVWILVVLLMTIAVATGNVIKGVLKGWPLMAEQLLVVSEGSERIVVIKDPFDEYFDPIFFYVHRPIEIVSAQDEINRCSTSTIFVARRSWLESHQELIPGTAHRMTTLRELKRAFGSSPRGEDIEVFKCFSAPEHKPQLTEELRDAVLDS